MKEPILKWLSCLYRGTTWGYATRSDCMMVAGFFALLYFLLACLYYLSGYIMGLNWWAVSGHIRTFPFSLFWLTIIANTSLFFMRVNDIFGKRCFRTKKHVLAFIAVFAITFCIRLIFEASILDFYIHVWFILLCCIISCTVPSATGEREEMPVVEYKLPKKTIAIMSFAVVIFLGMSLSGLILFCQTLLQDGFDCPFLR